MKLLKKKSWRIVLMFIAAAAFLLWIGNPVPQETTTPDRSVVRPPVSNSLEIINETNPTFQDMGTIGIIFGDPESGQNDTIQTFFTADDGSMYEVVTDTDTPLEYLEFYGDFVHVWGTVTNVNNNDSTLPRLYIASVSPTQADQQSDVRGNTRWVNIACRFSDMTDVTPKPIEYFQAMMVNEPPGMDHYWRATSANLVNIEGSGAFGWYNLPREKTSYLRMPTGTALQTLMNDCVQLAIQNDNVDFTQYGGINMMLNDTFGCCAWGGSMQVNIGSTRKQFRTTWLPPWAFDSLHVIGHEMGHGWGLPHSSGPYGKVYDSAWDVMSGGNSNHTDAICRVGHEILGCYQVGTISFHLAMLGWIPQDQIVVVQNGSSATVTLDALTTLATSSNKLAVFIPIGSTNTFYTVEVRNFIDYDRNLPGEAVVMHQIMPSRSSPAHVVDADNNGNPNDAGAMWLPGETFRDTRNNIQMEVLSRDGSSFTVRVTNGN